jgi:phage-related protein
MTFNSIDLTAYLKGISISGRGLEEEREIEEIPGTDPLEVSKVDKLNRITVKASIIGETHTAYRSSAAALRTALSESTEKALSFTDDVRTWSVFVESLKIEPHEPVSSCLSADVEIKFVGRCAS